jgi:hypothetical protein
MKIPFLLIFFVLMLGSILKANEDCIWESSKSGLTIYYVASCNYKNQIFLDRIVNKTVSHINRQDTCLEILVLVNLGQLSFSKADYANFFSIAYDTLRLIDDEFVFNYYWKKDMGELDSDEIRKTPLDINSTKIKVNDELGIKIIYDRDFRLGKPQWTKLIKAIDYASKNVEFIKGEQKTHSVRYNTNGWYVSLPMLDSAKSNVIIDKESLFSRKEGVKLKNAYFYIIFIVGIFLVLFTISLRKNKAHTTSNK